MHHACSISLQTGADLLLDDLLNRNDNVFVHDLPRGLAFRQEPCDRILRSKARMRPLRPCVTDMQKTAAKFARSLHAFHSIPVMRAYPLHSHFSPQ